MLNETYDERIERESKDNYQRRSRITNPTPYSGLGKLPPQAVDIEEVVLGALMLEKDSFLTISEWLKAEMFYKDNHQKIFSAITSLHNSGSPIDILTITAALRKAGELEMIGGAYYITELTNRVAGSANIETHSRIIYEKYLQREMIRISTDTIQLAYDDTTDIFQLHDDNQTAIYNAFNFVSGKNIDGIETLLAENIAELSKPIETGLTGIGSGFYEIDRLTNGWQQSDLVIIAARPAMGKCLGRGTGVIMFDGTIKKVENIKVGDQLMGTDSTFRNVLSLNSGYEQMYWIRQNKGIDYRVNESHILSLKRSGTQGQTKHGDIINIELVDYLKQSPKFKIRNKGYKCKIEFELNHIEIDPYFLGIWLGDGSSDDQNLSNPDFEIAEFIKEFCYKNDMRFSNRTSKGKHCPELSICKITGKENKIKTILSNIGVLNNKHIPNNFIVNSRDNRMKLLAGLIDTDGYYDKRFNVMEIIQVRELLANQIKYLCHTLGLACTIKKVKKGIKSRDFIGDYFRLIISGDLHYIPTKVKRKQATISKNKRNVLVTGIKVEKDIIDKFYGFEIDGDKLFMLEDCTVTHNSALMLKLARNAAVDFDKPVVVFSLEMAKRQLVNRLISDETDIPLTRILKRQLSDYDKDRLNTATQKLRKAKIFIDDTPSLSIQIFRSKCIRLKKKHDIQLIIIDYLQLMTISGSTKIGNREQEISKISAACKALAKELNVPVIALSQLSRQVESRAGMAKRPMLSDLRESGSIEQDADQVLFLYRPEYYGITEDGDGNSVEQLCEVIFAKFRNGETDTVKLRFDGTRTRFSDWTQISNQFPATDFPPNNFTPSDKF